MKRVAILLGLAIVAVYLATGIYVVSGNEVAAVRRFGRFDSQLRTSGLHFDWPWPFVNVDRLALNQARTVTLGATGFDLPASAVLALPHELGTSSGMLTGDKNILSVRAQVQYRPQVDRLSDALYQAVDADARLQAVGESVLADLVARSGVDYVHTIGLQALAERLADDLNDIAARQQWGLEIDHVTIDQVSPPLEVKADFLDVSNARADRAKYVNQATAYAEQKTSETRAEQTKLLNDARQAARTAVEQARGRADRFASLLERLPSTTDNSDAAYAQARQWTMDRELQSTLRDILSRVRPIIVSEEGRYQLSIDAKPTAPPGDRGR